MSRKLASLFRDLGSQSQDEEQSRAFDLSLKWSSLTDAAGDDPGFTDEIPVGGELVTDGQVRGVSRTVNVQSEERR